jgi:hypothetical protein
MSLFSTVGSDGLGDEAAPPIPAQTKRGTRTMGHASRTMTAPLAVPEPKPPIATRIHTAAANNAMAPRFTHVASPPDTSDWKRQWLSIIIHAILYALLGAYCVGWYLLANVAWTVIHGALYVLSTPGRSFVGGIAVAAGLWYLHSRGIL